MTQSILARDATRQLTDLDTPVGAAEEMDGHHQVDKYLEKLGEDWAQPVRHLVFNTPVQYFLV